MRRKAINGFETLAHAWQLKIERSLTEVIRDLDSTTSQKPFRFFAMSDDNMARLLNLRTLLIDQHLNLGDILRVILLKYRKPDSGNTRLGLRVANLTGPAALKVAIAALDTGDSNAWKVQERQNQVSALVSFGTLEYNDPTQITEDYFENLDRLKAKMEQLSTRLSRRPYRWNPWL